MSVRVLRMMTSETLTATETPQIQIPLWQFVFDYKKIYITSVIRIDVF